MESALNSPERLFHLMGYVSSGQQSMVLEGPVELDKVTVVARDCLLAFVECQVNNISQFFFQSHISMTQIVLGTVSYDLLKTSTFYDQLFKLRLLSFQHSKVFCTTLENKMI